MMKTKPAFFVLSFCLLIGLELLAQKDSLAIAKILKGESTPIMGITEVNDMDSKESEPNAREGGALSMERLFSTRYNSNLRPCTDEVHKICSHWVDQLKLIASKDYKSPIESLYYIWSFDKKGIFELRYKTKEDGSWARVWMDYYTLSGNRLDPETIPEFLKTYKINELWSQLKQGIECASKP